MAFVADTKILTSKGWKYIRDISGRDRVLVKNFIGDAEFIQPFALKKSWYEGEVIKFGSTYWASTLTPDHKVVFELERARIAEEVVEAKDVKVDKHKFLHRKFRYIREDKANEKILLYGGIKRSIFLSDEDWYTIVAYTITCGFISKDKNPRLKFMVGELEKIPRLTSIFDMMGIDWNLGFVSGKPVITVNRDNNLARKLKNYLGARARRDMRLPDKMVYGSSQLLMKHFLGTFTDLVAKPSKKRPNQLIMTIRSPRLIESLRMMCVLMGYGFSATETDNGHVAYIIPRKVGKWTVIFVEKLLYSGYVYEIDLFHGQVYVTERNYPVWLPPK